MNDAITEQINFISSELNKLELKGFSNWVTISNVGIRLTKLEELINNTINNYESIIKQLKCELRDKEDLDSGRESKDCYE